MGQMFSLSIFYFQQITSNTVQYIQFIRKLGLEGKCNVSCDKVLSVKDSLLL